MCIYYVLLSTNVLPFRIVMWGIDQIHIVYSSVHSKNKFVLDTRLPVWL